MKLTHGLTALTLMLSATAAQAELTATVTGVSDYDFRGITQTAHDPAIQGSIDYSHPTGFYVGVWASNIDFGDDGNVEVDWYGGFRGGEEVEYDVGLIWYSFPDHDANVDWGEVYGSVGWEFLTAKISYSEDFNSLDSNSAFRYELNANYGLPHNLGVNAHVAYNDGDYWDNAYGGGYTDWSVGVTYDLGHFTLGLKWIDGSDLKDRDDFCPGNTCGHINKDVFSTDARAVFAVSTTFPWKNDE